MNRLRHYRSTQISEPGMMPSEALARAWGEWAAPARPWKGTYGEYLRTPHWRQMRARKLALLGVPQGHVQEPLPFMCFLMASKSTR